MISVAVQNIVVGHIYQMLLLSERCFILMLVFCFSPSRRRRRIGGSRVRRCLRPLIPSQWVSLSVSVRVSLSVSLSVRVSLSLSVSVRVSPPGFSEKFKHVYYTICQVMGVLGVEILWISLLKGNISIRRQIGPACQTVKVVNGKKLKMWHLWKYFKVLKLYLVHIQQFAGFFFLLFTEADEFNKVCLMIKYNWSASSWTRQENQIYESEFLHSRLFIAPSKFVLARKPLVERQQLSTQSTSAHLTPL